MNVYVTSIICLYGASWVFMYYEYGRFQDLSLDLEILKRLKGKDLLESDEDDEELQEEYDELLDRHNMSVPYLYLCLSVLVINLPFILILRIILKR
jgi:hypothetical protein